MGMVSNDGRFAACLLPFSRLVFVRRVSISGTFSLAFEQAEARQVGGCGAEGRGGRGKQVFSGKFSSSHTSLFCVIPQQVTSARRRVSGCEPDGQTSAVTGQDRQIRLMRILYYSGSAS